MHHSEGTGYPILGLRRLLRDIYTMVKAKNSRNLMMIHMSAHDLMPALSFSDVILDGEHIAARKWDCSEYWKMLNLEEFRGEIYGRQWGPAPMYLSTVGYKKGCLEAYAPSEYVLSYALIHDVLLWGRFTDDIMGRVYAVYDQFGVKDASFVPYWKSGRYAKVESNGGPSSHVKASIYTNKGQTPNRTLLIVSNLGQAEEDVTIKLDFAALGYSSPPKVRAFAIDSATHESNELPHDGRISLHLPGYTFRLVGID
jgi:hypothetical protein